MCSFSSNGNAVGIIGSNCNVSQLSGVEFNSIYLQHVVKGKFKMDFYMWPRVLESFLDFSLVKHQHWGEIWTIDRCLKRLSSGFVFPFLNAFWMCLDFWKCFVRKNFYLWDRRASISACLWRGTSTFKIRIGFCRPPGKDGWFSSFFCMAVWELLFWSLMQSSLSNDCKGIQADCFCWYRWTTELTTIITTVTYSGVL